MSAKYGDLTIYGGSSRFMSKLGFGAFDTPMFDFNIQLLIMSTTAQGVSHGLSSVDATAQHDVESKGRQLRESPVRVFSQNRQLMNPDARIVLDDVEVGDTLAKYALSYQGIKSGDDNRLKQYFWECAGIDKRWRFTEGSLSKISRLGYSYRVDWSGGGALLARLQGVAAFYKRGISITSVGRLIPMLHCANVFASELAAVIPRSEEYL